MALQYGRRVRAARANDQARDYHLAQIEVFAHTAKLMQVPVAISFTVETDGHLPTGQSLRSAIMEVDEATDAYPSYYMINCAPTRRARAMPN